MPDSPGGLDPFVEFEHPGVGHIELYGEFDDEYVFSLIRSERQFYESEVLRLLERIGIEGGLAIDAGAHIGNHTVFFAKVLELKTLAVEPRVESVKVLRKNLAANGVEDTVTVVVGALGAEPGRAHLEQRIPENTGTTTTRIDETGPVEVHRLDDLVDEPVALIKVDVEGDEKAVLEGGKTLLRRFRPVVVVEAHSGKALAAIESILGDFDYEPIGIFGRSDNYLFASKSSAALIPFEKAQTRAALYAERRRSQLLNTGIRDISAQVRRLGLQVEKIDDLDKRLTNLELALTRVEGHIIEVSETQAEQLEALKQVLASRDRQLVRWQQEYRRVTRSRGLRATKKLRSVVAKTGLIDEMQILTPEEIEASVEDKG